MKKTLLLILLIMGLPGGLQAAKRDAPRIINIVNFIRLLEPRDARITQTVLYETVVKQVELMNRYDFPGTFLLQYDALADPRYQELFKTGDGARFEIGGWWEITQPHVEAAGIKWRGRYPWDWHANVGFSTGYTPEEREKLVDVYMEKFKSVFGKYPTAIGSWFIDEYSLNYMYEKYGLKVSCNVKDQWGTDGYTVWGGYWNQAYYPSKKNAYMPAQTREGQIPVPIFRMLGSDPIYQCGLNSSPTSWQSVTTLEPVYPESGGNRHWVEWFLRCLTEDPCLGFQYAQAGQENSFTWAAMKEGLEMQFALLDQLRREHRIRIETLGQSGEWFRSHYAITPPTALSALTDVRDEDNRTVWYNSRFYRANLIWTKEAFLFRDIHLFDENLESAYRFEPTTKNQCFYMTLPVVDGMLWSQTGKQGGLKLVETGPDGRIRDIRLKDIRVTNQREQVLHVESVSDERRVFTFTFYEDRMEIAAKPEKDSTRWFLELYTYNNAHYPFTKVTKEALYATEMGMDYRVVCRKGHFEEVSDRPDVRFRIVPEKERLILDFSRP